MQNQTGLFSIRKHIRQLVMKEIERWIQGQAFFLSRKTNSCWVLIVYYGTKKTEVTNKKCGNFGRILLLEINIDDNLFVLINIYNANNEPDHLKTLADLDKTIDCVGDIQNKNIIFGGDFNIISNSFFEAHRGEPSLKKKHISKNNSNKKKVQPSWYFQILKPLN